MRSESTQRSLAQPLRGACRTGSEGAALASPRRGGLLVGEASAPSEPHPSSPMLPRRRWYDRVVSQSKWLWLIPCGVALGCGGLTSPGGSDASSDAPSGSSSGAAGSSCGGSGGASGGSSGSSSGGSSSGGSSGGGGNCPTCPKGALCCDGVTCVNPLINPQNCGACGNSCNSGTGTCSNGQCVAAPCFAVCDAGVACCGYQCCDSTEVCCPAMGNPSASGYLCLPSTAEQPTCPMQ